MCRFTIHVVPDFSIQYFIAFQMKKLNYFALFSSLLFTLFYSSNAFAGGFVMMGADSTYWRPADQVMSYAREFPEDFSPFQVQLTSEEAYVKIVNGRASVEIKQQFYYMGRDSVNAYFILPVPKDEQFDDLTIVVDETKQFSKFYDHNKSYYTWSDLVKRTGDPTYWRYSDQAFHSVAFYNMPPGANMTVTTIYSQKLRTVNGKSTFTYPCSGQQYAISKIRNFEFELEINSENQIKNVYTPNKELVLQADEEKGLLGTLVKQNGKMQEDISIQFNTSEDLVGYNLLAYKEPGKKDGRFILSFDAGVGKRPEVVNKHFTFLIDASAGMSGDLAATKKAVVKCLEQLDAKDQFNVITFNEETKSAFLELMPASAGNISTAKTFVNGISASGGCNLEYGIKRALAPPEFKENPFMVFLISGSDITAGTKDHGDIISAIEKASAKHRYIYPIGVNSTCNTHVLGKMAKATRGFSRYVSEGNVEQAIVSFYEEIGTPIFNNMQMYFTNDFSIPVSHPSAFDRLMFQGKPMVISGKYRAGGMAKVALTGNVNGELKRFDYEIPFPDVATLDPLIPKLCASREMGYILNQIRLEGDFGDDLADQVYDLAEDYKLINQYSVHVLFEDFQYMSAKEKAEMPDVFQGDNDFSTEYEGLTTATGKQSIVAANDVIELMSMTSVEDISKPQARMGVSNSSASKGGSAAGKGVKRGGCISLSGRSICKEGDVWVDSMSKYEKGSAERIAFGSAAYYSLVQNNRDIAPIICLGKLVKFVEDGSIYEVYEEEVKEEEE